MRSTSSLLGCLFLAVFYGCGSDEPPINDWQCANAAVDHGTTTVCEVPSFGGPISHYTCLPATGAVTLHNEAPGGSDSTAITPSDGSGSGPACPPGSTPAPSPPSGGTSDAPPDSSTISCDVSGGSVQCTSTTCDKGFHTSACGTCVPDGCSSCSCAADGGTSGGGGTGGCTLTQGYWKNHPAAWPVKSLTLGSATYSEAQLLAILGTPPGGDASLILAHQLIAALLNEASGAGQAPIATAVAQAQAWLSANSGGKLLPYGVSASSAAGAQAVALANQLDAYNNGLSGVPHCK